MADITGYQRLDDGAYRFHAADGSSFLAAGDAAAQKAMELDALGLSMPPLAPMPDQRLASVREDAMPGDMPPPPPAPAPVPPPPPVEIPVAIEAERPMEAPAPRVVTGTSETPSAAIPYVGPRAVHVPAGSVPTVDPRLAAEWIEADKKRVEAEHAAAMTQAAYASAQADEMRQAAAQAEIERDKGALQERILQQRQMEAQNLLDESYAQRVDPNRVMAKQSTFERIMGALALAAGEMTGGRNPAREMMDRAIATDLREQEQRRALGIERGKSRLDFWTTRLGSTKAARAATEAEMWNIAARKAEALAVSAKGSAMADNARVALEHARQKQAEAEMKFRQWIPAHTVMVGGYGDGKDGKLAPGAPDPDAYVPGLGFARDTTDAREITKDRANLEELRRDTDDLLRMTSSFAGRAVPGEAKAKIAALANKVKIKAKDVAKLGVMSDSDSRLLDAMMGDPTSAVRVDGLAGLRQFRAGVDRSDDLLRSHYGVTPGRVAVIDTPKGQRRVGVYTGQPTEPRGAVRFTPSAGGGPK